MNNLSNCEKEENSNKRINLDRMVKKIVDNENTRNDFEKTEINSCKKGLYENLEKTNSNDDVTIENESLLKFTITCFFTIAAAGIGMAVAGRFLELGQESYLFTSYPSLIAIFPPLVGMKGNIEMTLASRLGTLVSIL